MKWHNVDKITSMVNEIFCNEFPITVTRNDVGYSVDIEHQVLTFIDFKKFIDAGFQIVSVIAMYDKIDNKPYQNIILRPDTDPLQILEMRHKFEN